MADLVIERRWVSRRRGSVDALTVCCWQWRWRDEELFKGSRSTLQQKLRMVISSVEEKGEAFRLHGHENAILNMAIGRCN